ncbi:MAG: hypothetical protein M1404_08060 [Acidobacteria bacterium]|nr:hypothetical protein [Acidobacteriota bacterium]
MRAWLAVLLVYRSHGNADIEVILSLGESCHRAKSTLYLRLALIMIKGDRYRIRPLKVENHP